MQQYDAFISYSHAGDGQLAPRLQSGLERYARPWWKRRVLRVFRDETGLSASPHLWSSIVEALDDARWFIVLASPEGAGSMWVGREIEHWMAHRDPHRILLAITDGTFVWDETTNDIDWQRSTAAHPVLRNVFASEPRHIDLTWARADVHLDRRDGRFQDALAELAAPLRGVPKDDLAGEDVRQHRRTIRLARAAAAALALLTALAVFAGVLAIGQRDEARSQRTTAEAQRAEAEAQRAEAETQRTEAEAQRVRADESALTATARGASANAASQADTDIDRSLLLGAAAVGLQPSDETAGGLLAALDSAAALVAVHHEPGEIKAMSLHPDDSRVVTLDADGNVRVWTYPEVELIVERQLSTDIKPYSLEYLKGGDVIAMVAETGFAMLDAATLEPIGETIAPTDLFDDPVVLADPGDDGRTVAVSQYNSTRVDLVSTSAGATTSSIEVDPSLCFGAIRGVDLHQNSSRLAVACQAGVTLYDAESGELVNSLESFAANSVTFSPDGRLLAISNVDDSLTLIDLHSFTTFAQIDAPGSRTYAMDFSNDSRFLAVASDSGEVAVYFMQPDRSTIDPETGEIGTYSGTVLDRTLSGMDGGVLAVNFSSSSASRQVSPRVLAGGPSGLTEWDMAQVPSMATAHLRSPDDGPFVHFHDPVRQELYRHTQPWQGPWSGAAPTQMEVVGLDGNVVRTLEFEGAGAGLLEQSRTTGQLVVTGVGEWPEQTQPPTQFVAPTRLDIQIVDLVSGDVALTLDLASAMDIVVPELPPGVPLPDFGSGPDGRWIPTIFALFSPDGDRLLVAVDGETLVWDVASDTLLMKGAMPVGEGITAWTPDGTMLLVGGFLGDISLFRADNFSLLKSVQLEVGYTISAVDVSVVLDRVVVTAESGNIYLIEVPSLRVDGQPFQANGVQLQESRVDDDGELVVSIDRSDNLYLWRVADRSPIGPPVSVATNGIGESEVEFVDGGVLIDTRFGEVVVVPTDFAVLARRACELAGRELAVDEWQTYVGDRPQVACGSAE